MTITTLRREDRPAERQLPPSMAERITLIIDLFETPFHRLPLEDVARRSGLPRSTAHRILDQLIALDWLDHNRDGYGLGRRATRLVGGGHDHTALRAAAAPLLHALSMRTDLVVHLAVLDHQDVLYLDKVGGPGAAAIGSRVGGLAPAHSTALGKAMLAWLEPEQVDALFPGPLRRLTDRTVTDVIDLHGQLALVRRRHGLAFERGETAPGVDCVAVAIRDCTGPLAAISVVGPSGAPLERLAPLVMDAVSRVSTELFGPRGRANSGRLASKSA
ncbi:MAG: IclR family transcriptional regulator [Mycobacteriales bacterium]